MDTSFEMKGLMILLALGLASSDKLDRTYLPPPGAKSSGGNLGAVDAPLKLPKESPSTTIRPRPQFTVRPKDTKLTAGINRGQLAPTGKPTITSTTRPFVSKYIPSTTPASIYSPTTKPEGFGTTSSPIGSTGFPSERPGQKLRPVYGSNGQVIGVTPTPVSVEVCEENDARCQKAQQVSPVYGPNSQIIGQQVTPTSGSVQGLQPVYGSNGEIIGVTPIPGTVQICKDGDVICQKQGQQNVPVYGPNGQVVGYQPSFISTPESVRNLQPVYGPSGQIIGQQPIFTSSSGTVQVCKETDARCLKQAQEHFPVYGPSGQIVGYQPSVNPSPGKVQGLQPVFSPSGKTVGEIATVTREPVIIQGPSTQGQQIVPVYGNNGQIIGYKPSVIPTTATVQSLQPVYGPSGQIIGQQPTTGTVQVCREGNVQCQKHTQQNVPVYGPSGQIVGYQPSVTPTPGTSQGLNPVYGQYGEIIGVAPAQDIVEFCKDGDVSCHKRAQQNVPVYGPNGKIYGYRPIATSTSGTSHGPVTQGKSTVPIYGPYEQEIGFQPSVTPTSGTGKGLQPVYSSSGQLGQLPIPTTVEVCREDDVQCQKQSQQNVPIYGPSGQIVGYQPIVTPGFVQSLQPIYDSSGKFVGQRPAGLVQGCKEGDVQCQKQTQQFVPVYGPSGEVIGQQPSVIPIPGTVQGFQPVYGPNGQIIGQKPVTTPTPGTVQICQKGDVQCQEKSQQFVPVYGPSGKVIDQQPSVTPLPGMVQGLQPVYSPSGQIMGQQPVTTPTPGTVQICQKGDAQCQKQTQSRPLYGPSGQIIGQQVTPTPGIISSLQPVYGPSGQIITQQPTQISPTTGKPVIGGTKSIYQPGSTSTPSVTTPSYYPSSSFGTTPTPFQDFGSTSSGVVITNAGTKVERPLAESDRKAVTINYDITLTPDGYSYSYDTSNGIHVDETGEVKDGKKAVGTYSYIGDDGKEYQVTYKADKNGFQPTGDHLPTPHPIPAEIQRVIEQAVKDKQAGISDDGSYNEGKYGHERYDRPNRPKSGDRQRPTTPGLKPSKPSHEEEGYHYAPPKSKFPPHLSGRGQTKRPHERYEDKSTTPSVNISEDDYDTESGENLENQRPRPSGEQETGITTYRPTGQVDKFGRPIYSRPGQGVGSTTYRPFVSPQGQEDKYGRPIPSQSGQETGDTLETNQVDKYGRPISKRPGQGYSTTTETSQVDEFGKPIYSQTEEEPLGTNQPGQIDQYGRPVSLRPGQEIGSTTYRPTISSQPTPVEKLGGPIYSQTEEDISGTAQPEKVDKYGRPVPSRFGHRYSTTTYRPIGTSKPSQVDKFGRPIYSQPEEDISGTAQPVQVDEYGRPIYSTSRPTQGYVDKFGRPIYSQHGEEPSGTAEPVQVDKYGRPVLSSPGQGYVDKFGRPIYAQPGEEPSGTAEPGHVDKYGRPISSRPQVVSTTYRPVATTETSQVDELGRPIFSQPGEESSATAKPGKVDKYGRPIPSRPGQGIVSTTYRPTVSIQPQQVDDFGRPIYSKPGEEPVRTTEPSQVDKFGRPFPSRPRQEFNPTTARPGESSGCTQLDAFGRPIYPASSESPEGAQPVQVDKYGRPLPSRPGQKTSSTTYRPVGTTQTEPVDEYGRPISYVPGEPTESTLLPQDAYGRPTSSRTGQIPSSVTRRPVSSTSAPGYQSGSDVSEGPAQKPEEFGPHQKQGPAYLSPYEDKPGKIIGEDFRGPKQPPRFDPKTGYHY